MELKNLIYIYIYHNTPSCSPPNNKIFKITLNETNPYTCLIEST